jgi:hypothetical protein
MLINLNCIDTFSKNNTPPNFVVISSFWGEVFFVGERTDRQKEACSHFSNFANKLKNGKGRCKETKKYVEMCPSDDGCGDCGGSV